MLNLHILTEIPRDLAILANVITKVQANMPLWQKNLADLRQAIADQKNPVALLADIQTLLSDLDADLKVFETILPPAAPAGEQPAPANA